MNPDKRRRKEEAEARAEARRSRTDVEQALMLLKRPGSSKREIERLSGGPVIV